MSQLITDKTVAVSEDSIQVTQKAVKAPEHIHKLLQRLHKASLDQENALKAPGGEYEKMLAGFRSSEEEGATYAKTLMKDKFIALDADKASFVYNLIRSSQSLNVVEAGTSYGVSTIYLSLAVGQNAKAAGKKPGEAKVIATEHEPEKALQAKKYWQEAGDDVVSWIELREGDLLETLKTDLPVIDFVLFDIWTPMLMPTLKLLEGRFRPGTTLIADNVVSSASGYAEFFSVIDAGPYTKLTVPFENGLAIIVYSP